MSSRAKAVVAIALFVLVGRNATSQVSVRASVELVGSNLAEAITRDARLNSRPLNASFRRTVDAPYRNAAALADFRRSLADNFSPAGRLEHATTSQFRMTLEPAPERHTRNRASFVLGGAAVGAVVGGGLMYAHVLRCEDCFFGSVAVAGATAVGAAGGALVGLALHAVTQR